MILKLTSLLILSLVFSIAAEAANVCYTGNFSVAQGRIKLKYEITNNNLHVEVTNPEDPITLNNGTVKPARQAFDPGPDMKLIPMDGVKCPCLALQTEKGNFTFIVNNQVMVPSVLQWTTLDI